MRYLLTALVCITIIIGVHGQENVNTPVAIDNVPYIYYYSHVLNGVVIERADGTDSRIIGQDLVEEDASYIRGVGWSPHGDWFALRTEVFSFPYGSPDNKQGYVIHIDGETHLAWMEYLGCVRQMWWHPTENILLVQSTIVHREANCSGREPILTYSLLNVDTQERLATFSVDIMNDLRGFPRIFSGDDYIQFITATETVIGGDYRTQPFIVTMYFDGNVTMENISWDELSEIDFASRIFRNEEAYDQFIDYGFYTINGTPSNPPPNSSASGRDVAASWSPDGYWMLVGYDYCIAGCANIPYRVNIFNPTTEHNREISSCGTHSACVNWLPERVNVGALPEGQDYPVLPVPDSVEFQERSLTNTHFLLLNTHEVICESTQSAALVRNVEIGTIDFTMPNSDYCGELDYGEYMPTPVIFALSPDENYYAVTDASEFTALYHADTGNLIARLNFYGVQLSFSEDSTELITSGRFAEAKWNIQRLIEQYAMNS